MSAGYLETAGGGGGGSRVPFIPLTPLGAMQSSNAMGMALDFFVQGDEAKDLVSDTALVQVGGVVDNQATTALRDGEPPPPNVTTALGAAALNESWDAWNSSVNDIATGSALAALTFFLRAIPGSSQNLLAKSSATVGMELFVNTNREIQCDVRSLGNPLRSAKLPGIFEVGRWHTVVCLIDRSVPGGLGGGQLILAGTNESTSRAANTVATNLEAADLSNASTWAWGAQRIAVSANMLGLCVAVAMGEKVEGRNARIIAENIAAATWAANVIGGITP